MPGKLDGIWMFAWLVFLALAVGAPGGEEGVPVSGEAVREEGVCEPGPRIALTFDDGPGPYTERLLDGLIGNHTYSHVKLKGLSPEETRREIQKTDEAVYEITGKHVAYLRPPFGEWEEDLELTYPVLPVMWTVDPLDWTTENVEEIVDRVVTQAGENDMILLHDCYDSSVEAALRIVDRLLAEGFDFVRVDELLIP